MPSHDDNDGNHGYRFPREDDSRDDPVDADLIEPAHSIDFIQCPHCKKYCHEEAIVCPRCKHSFMERDRARMPRWYLLTVLGLLLLIVLFWVLLPLGAP